MFTISVLTLHRKKRIQKHIFNPAKIYIPIDCKGFMAVCDDSISITNRQRVIDSLVALVRRRGPNSPPHLISEDRIVLVDYGNQWGGGNRLGVVAYSENGDGVEYVFNSRGVEGVRLAEFKPNPEKPREDPLKRSSTYLPDMEASPYMNPERMPLLVRNLI